MIQQKQTRGATRQRTLFMGRKKLNNVVLYMRVPEQHKEELKQMIKDRLTELRKQKIKQCKTTTDEHL